jgi:heat shock protein HtpX
MAIAKRIFLFLLMNFLVVITISTVLSLLGVQPYLQSSGLNIESLAVFCLVWGMGGSFISLLMSRQMAKWMMGVRLVSESDAHGDARELVQMVRELSIAAGMTMPQVGIFNSPQMNAFATGPSKSRSLVAVSSGLLSGMDRKQVRGVLAHEIAHIQNGDMVTMTLLQGIVNAFVMFLARVLAFAVAQSMGRRDDDREGGFSYLTFSLATFAFEMVFMVLGSIVVAAFSRLREFRADAGGARLAGRDQMVSALQALQRNIQLPVPTAQQNGAFRSMQIDGGQPSLMMKLFSTHPPLNERIARLQSGQY